MRWLIARPMRRVVRPSMALPPLRAVFCATCGDTAYPCDATRRHAASCGRCRAGALHLQAPDAEVMMRPWCSAYLMGLPDCLLDTWHPSRRPADAIVFEFGLRWLGLGVRRQFAQGADHARVEFGARSKLGGRAHRLRETSRFMREDGRWLYVDGELR